MSEAPHGEERPTEARLMHMVFPDHTNHLGTLFGGQALAWMDMASFIAASRYARTTVVTARSDQVDFKLPISIGQMVVRASERSDIVMAIKISGRMLELGLVLGAVFLFGLLIGGQGNDTLAGGAGTDTASYSSLNLAEGVSVDLRISGAQDTGAGGIDTLTSIENLIGSGAADVLTGRSLDVCGRNDHADIRIEFAHLGQHFEAVHSVHDHVEQHEIMTIDVIALQSGGAVGGFLNGVAHFFQHLP